jgi:hypothetical protein
MVTTELVQSIVGIVEGAVEREHGLTPIAFPPHFVSKFFLLLYLQFF